MFSDHEMRQAWYEWSPTQRGRMVTHHTANNNSFFAIQKSRERALARTKDQLSRIANKTPQVVVKVTKRKTGANAVFDNFTYIGRHGKTEIEDQDGCIITERDELKRLSEKWAKPSPYSQREKAAAIGMVLSMPEGTDAETLHHAARAFARTQFEDKYEYLMALHTDTPRPHVHITVKLRGRDAKQFRPSRESLQLMREDFAMELRARGIEADATPQPARLQRRQNDTSKIDGARKIAFKRGEPFYLDQKYMIEANKLVKGLTPLNNFEEYMKRKIEETKALYITMAKKLESSDNISDRVLGEKLNTFISENENISFSRRSYYANYLKERMAVGSPIKVDEVTKAKVSGDIAQNHTGGHKITPIGNVAKP